MKPALLSIVLLCAAVFLAAGVVQAADGAITTEEQIQSYMLGNLVAKDFKEEGIVVDQDVFMSAVKDTLSGSNLKLNENEMKQAFATFLLQMGNKRAERKAKEADVNKKAGEAFLAANAKKQGVKTLPSGLQYMVLKEGKGPSPTAKDVVTLHYYGSSIDGECFDKSIERGAPAFFGMADVLPGWEEALKIMKPGAKWRVFVPPQLAYGGKGLPDKVGPDSTLIYDLELFSVFKEKKK
jgi:FKBP-type peptidyl-prolyl cis-trans isomerase FklB